MKALIAAVGILSLLASTVRADGAADNIPSAVRQVPPPGIEISPDDRDRLSEGLAQLKSGIEELQKRDDPQIAGYLPDIEIFHRAVDQALRFNEMFAPGDIKKADALLAEGLKRAGSLAENDPYWTRQKGLVVRGFRSKLDDTVQPYGLVIPDTYRADIPYRYRTDIWFHGRGEKSVELQFIHQRMHDPGQYQPADTIVLHPFGRYSNAFKFAGEVDVLEALDHAKANYRIDDDRISVRGFSMGGAACWQFAVHYADQWFAANPGAGFSETPQFLQTFQGEVLHPTWWEKTLWQWYDCPPWVDNLYHCPLIAYSGEHDRQKQAADVMANAYEGIVDMTLAHIIGKGMGHKIDEESKIEINKRMQTLESALLVENKGLARLRHTEFTTSTLRYNKSEFLTINGLTEHWKFARVKFTDPMFDAAVVANGVTDLSIEMPAGTYHGFGSRPVRVRIVEDEFDTETDACGEVFAQSDRSLKFRAYYHDGEWHVGTPPWEGELRKRHGLQGPIDDALMDSFVFVKPSGECRHPLVEQWTTAELEHAVTHWRQQMRGDARVKADNDITEEDIANHNLILWGDPASNSVMQRIADQLPIAWGDKVITAGDRKFDAEHHAPILIYPNPLNPKKYVVLNSSFTYREYDYLNNARQTPKLPDWAVVDLRVKPDSRWPGKIVDADFFNEKWELQQPYRERMSEQTE